MNRLQKLRKWLQEQQLEGVILTRRDSFSWLTGGKRNHVLQSTELGIAHLLVTADGLDLLADNIDAARIHDEELGMPVTMRVRDWFQDEASFIKKLIVGRNIVSDTGIADTRNVHAALQQLRLLLGEEEQIRYRELGMACANVVETLCKAAKPGMTENQIANQLRAQCVARDISPDCVLVGSDERILKYRHPMPTDKKVVNSLMVVLGAAQYGLNISLTRMVYFTEPPQEVRHKHRLTQQIFAEAQRQTFAGNDFEQFFVAIQKAYAAAGYADEWKRHHQGGPTGYACREAIITPASRGVIGANQAFAWNPSITGTKCEDTTLLTQQGLELLTRTENWPTSIVESHGFKISAADILF